MQQLKDAEGAGQEAASDSKPATAKDKGLVGFTVKTLAPAGYVSPDGKPDTPASPTEQPLPAPTPRPGPTPGSGNYIFVGRTPIKGVTIYTPQDDPSGAGHTEKPKSKGPISNTMVYGSLGLGAALAIGGIWFTPLLLLGGLLLGAGAVLWYINRTFAK